MSARLSDGERGEELQGFAVAQGEQQPLHGAQRDGGAAEGALAHDDAAAAGSGGAGMSRATSSMRGASRAASVPARLSGLRMRACVSVAMRGVYPAPRSEIGLSRVGGRGGRREHGVRAPDDGQCHVGDPDAARRQALRDAAVRVPMPVRRDVGVRGVDGLGEVVAAEESRRVRSPASSRTSACSRAAMPCSLRPPCALLAPVRVHGGLLHDQSPGPLPAPAGYTWRSATGPCGAGQRRAGGVAEFSRSANACPHKFPAKGL